MTASATREPLGPGFALRLLLPVVWLGLFLLHGGLALAYEEPGYEVIKTFPEFELRQYEPFLVAETSVQGAFSEVGNQAFRRLFAYISEDKRPQGKIAMTTPVMQQPERPVAASEQGLDQGQGPVQGYRFAFVMPPSFTLDTLPVPENAAIALREVPPRLMAVRRYSGTWREETYRQNEQILFDAVRKEGLTIVGEPIFARYNAPFSLWFLRRNEVLLEIDPESHR